MEVVAAMNCEAAIMLAAALTALGCGGGRRDSMARRPEELLSTGPVRPGWAGGIMGGLAEDDEGEEAA